MRYELAQPWSGGKSPIQISEAEFAAIKNAKKMVGHALALEEKMDMLLNALVEFEQDTLNLALRGAVFHEYSWSGYRDHTRLMNRRILNLLAAGYLYVEQAPKDIVAIGGRRLLQQFRTAVDAASRATAPGFRIMNEIRRHIQHRGIPIGGLTVVNEDVVH